MRSEQLQHSDEDNHDDDDRTEVAIRDGRIPVADIDHFLNTMNDESEEEDVEEATGK